MSSSLAALVDGEEPERQQHSQSCVNVCIFTFHFMSDFIDETSICLVDVSLPKPTM